MKLTKTQREFLLRLRDERPLLLADRKEDRARQFCRRNGLAEVIKGYRRWAITEAGRAALKEMGE